MRSDFSTAYSAESLPYIVSGGVFRPFALAGGRPVGVWRIKDSRVVLEPFAGLSADDHAALRADGEDVIRYLAG